MALTAGAAAPASASLVGDTVFGSTSGPAWAFDPGSAVVVDPGVEFGLNLVGPDIRAFDVDLGGSTIDFDVLISVGNIFGLGPATLSDLDWVDDPSGMITGFEFQTDIPGLGADRLSFTDHSFSVDFDGLSTSTGQFLDITLITSHTPEPATIVICSLLGLGLRRRRRSMAA